MSKVILTKTEFTGSVNAPPSKSHQIRLLLAAALSREECSIVGYSECEDCEVMLNAIRALGKAVEKTADRISISGEITARKLQLDVGESATAFRLLLPTLSALGIDTEYTLSPSLCARPHDIIYDILESGGVHVSVVDSHVTASGRMQGGKYAVHVGQSSQYLSGMLFALPLTGTVCTIELVGEQVSGGYVAMTLSVLADAGIRWTKTDTGYSLRASRGYRIGGAHAVEGDWSGAAFWLAAGLLGDVTVRGLVLDSIMPDRKLLKFIQDFGAGVQSVTCGLRAVRSALTANVFSVTDTPDLFPILCIMAAFAQGDTVIYGTDRLRTKESDRVFAMTSNFDALGVCTEVDEDCVTIHGGGIHGGEISSFGDHRIAMAFAVLSGVLPVGESIILQGAECVAKSYPSFWSEYNNIGGQTAWQ